MAFKKLTLELCGTAVTPPVGCIPPPPPPPAMALWLPLEMLTSLEILLGVKVISPWRSKHPLAEWLPYYGAGYHSIKLSADVLQITFHNQNAAHLATNFLALHDHCLNCVADQGGNCGTTWGTIFEYLLHSMLVGANTWFVKNMDFIES